jgi:hypothetical protein
MLAARTDQPGAEQQQPEPEPGDPEGEHYQYINADAALLVLDTLLNRLWDLLSNASPEFLQREEPRLARLRNAYQGMEATRARQIAHTFYWQRRASQGGAHHDQ